MTLHRRELLSLAGAAALLSLPSHSAALSRPHYAKIARLSLPLDVTRIDPHDQRDPLAALIGSSLFEPLFGLDHRGKPYPTLASKISSNPAGGLTIDLRPGLVSAAGKRLNAATVVRSIARTQKASAAFASLGRVRAKTTTTLILDTQLLPAEAATLLASSTAAIIPAGFDPTRPDCTGALYAKRGRLVSLARNPTAPRGGSFLSEGSLRHASLADCLRDYESGRSDIGFLGSGLHQARRTSRSFSLGPLGWAILVPGKKLERFGAPGVMHTALSHLSGRGLSALGVTPSSMGASWSWKGPSFEILVEDHQPWLQQIALELSRLWSTRGTQVTARHASRQVVRQRLADGEHQATLTFIRADGPASAAIRELFALDGSPPPRHWDSAKPTSLPSLQTVSRRLGPGVVGALTPRGAIRADFHGLDAAAHFDLAGAHII